MQSHHLEKTAYSIPRVSYVCVCLSTCPHNIISHMKNIGRKKLVRCSHLIAIIRKKVPRPRKGTYMADWEETAAVSCAVQNMHLMASSMQVGCYWSSSGVGKNLDGYMQHEEIRRFLHFDPQDKCLGILHVGVPSPTLKVRATRGDIKEKVIWTPTSNKNI